MKKLIFTLMALVVATTSLWAYDFEVDGIYYNIIAKEKVSVTHRTDVVYDYEGAISIPLLVKYNGTYYDVVEIGERAFSGDWNLTSITIPNSIKEIGKETFKGCSGLTSVTIPNSVTEIGESAFEGCSRLTSVTIPNGVTEIKNRTFTFCSLTSVIIPNSVTEIGEYAFGFCGLSSIVIPNSVTKIGESAFEGCSRLTSIVVEDGNKYYSSDNGVLYNRDKSVLIACPAKKGAFVIPNSVTKIGGSAFANCSELTSITIPNSVTKIGESAFSLCRGLTSVTIPNSVTEIGGSAFANCYDLKNVNFNATHCLYTGGAYSIFYGCEALTTVNIGENVTCIPDYAFYNCNALTSVNMGANVTYIGYRAFEGTAWYNNQNDGVIYAGKTVLGYKGTMPEGTTLAIKEGTGSISANAFRNCHGLISVTIPNSVTEIGESAFDGCSGLASVTIPNSVTKIGEAAFYECSSLTSVTIPNSVTEIEESVFSRCTGLTSITIPNSVTKIGEAAFGGCSSLTSVTIPNSVTEIGGGAFNNTAWYNNQPDGEIYINKIFYDYKGTMPEDTTFAIKEGTGSISANAFRNCHGLISVTIPNSVTEIGESAFQNCSGLTSVTIPNSVIEIGRTAFEYCSGLTSVTIPNSVTEIGGAAFRYCKNLTTVILGNGVSLIDGGTFYGCQLTTLTIVDGTTELKFESSIDSLESLYLGRIISGISFQESKKLSHLTIGNVFTTIGSNMFRGCENLTSLALADGTTDLKIALSAIYGTSIDSLYIGRPLSDLSFLSECKESIDLAIGVENVESFQFSNYTQFTTVTFTDAVTMIRNSAFENCSEIAEITFGKNVSRIGSSAFAGCNKVRAIYCYSVTPPTATAATFTDLTYENAILYVPTGCKAIYQSTEPWSRFWDIRESEALGIEDTVMEGVTITTQNGAIVVNGLDAPMTIEVYSLSGQLLYRGNDTSIPVNERGIYLVRVGNLVEKVAL